MFLEKYGIIGHTLEYHINELSVRLQSVTITTSTILVFCKGHKEKHNIVFFSKTVLFSDD